MSYKPKACHNSKPALGSELKTSGLHGKVWDNPLSWYWLSRKHTNVPTNRRLHSSLSRPIESSLLLNKFWYIFWRTSSDTSFWRQPLCFSFGREKWKWNPLWNWKCSPPTRKSVAFYLDLYFGNVIVQFVRQSSTHGFWCSSTTPPPFSPVRQKTRVCMKPFRDLHCSCGDNVVFAPVTSFSCFCHLDQFVRKVKFFLLSEKNSCLTWTSSPVQTKVSSMKAEPNGSLGVPNWNSIGFSSFTILSCLKLSSPKFPLCSFAGSPWQLWPQK